MKEVGQRERYEVTRPKGEEKDGVHLILISRVRRKKEGSKMAKVHRQVQPSAAKRNKRSMAKAHQSTKAESLSSRLYIQASSTHQMKNLAEVRLSKQASSPPQSRGEKAKARVLFHPLSFWETNKKKRIGLRSIGGPRKKKTFCFDLAIRLRRLCACRWL